MSTQAQQLADEILEAYDEHVKAHDRIQKYDRAMGSWKKLAKLHGERDRLEKELAHGLASERALAYVGLKREDVARWIYAGQLGATDNYKKEFPVHACANSWCSARGQQRPLSQEVCRDCDTPLKTVMKPISRGDLQGKFGKYLVGVETRDGRRVWFDEMVPPRTYDWGVEAEEEPVKERPAAPRIPPRPLPRGSSY